jgi:hypothetical protein
MAQQLTPQARLKQLSVVDAVSNHPYYTSWPPQQRKSKQNRELERGQKHSLHALGLAFADALATADEKVLASQLSNDLQTIMDTHYSGTGPHRCAMYDCIKKYLLLIYDSNHKTILEKTNINDLPEFKDTYTKWTAAIYQQIHKVPQPTDGVFCRIQSGSLTNQFMKELKDAISTTTNKQMIHLTSAGEVRLQVGNIRAKL